MFHHFILSITRCSVLSLLTLFQDDSGKLFDSFIPIDGGVLHFNGFKNQSFSKRWIKVLSASQSFIDKLPSSVKSYDQEKGLIENCAHFWLEQFSSRPSVKHWLYRLPIIPKPPSFTMGGIVRFEKKICPSHFWPFLDVTCDICRDMKDMMDMMTNERTWWPMRGPDDPCDDLMTIIKCCTVLNTFIHC